MSDTVGIVGPLAVIAGGLGLIVTFALWHHAVVKRASYAPATDVDPAIPALVRKLLDQVPMEVIAKAGGECREWLVYTDAPGEEAGCVLHTRAPCKRRLAGGRAPAQPAAHSVDLSQAGRGLLGTGSSTATWCSGPSVPG